MVGALDRKLLRGLGRLRGQIATTAAVVACGVASFVAMRSTWMSLEESRNAYYERERFGDVFASCERAPLAVATRIAQVSGVALVEARLVEPALLPLDPGQMPAMGRVVSVSRPGAPGLDRVRVVRGRMPDRARTDEAVVLETFARARHLRPGDTLPVVVAGVEREVRVVGIGMSPEYVIALFGGEMMPDESRVAVLWMPYDAVATMSHKSGAFDDLVLRLRRDARTTEVVRHVDRLLAPYGSLGAYDRTKHLSDMQVRSRISRLQVMALWLPTVFLGVAAFLVHVVLSRLVLLERPQIATLKALGYSGARVGAHYLELVTIVVLLGAAVGLGVGAWLGHSMTTLFAQFFHFPALVFRVSPGIAAMAALIAIGTALVGALVTVRSVARLPPAEAMAPPAPPRYGVSVLERFGLGKLVGTSGRIALRELTRRPGRTLLSAAGVALSVAILVAGRFQYDSFDTFLDVQFSRAWREDLAVSFMQPVTLRSAMSLARVPGVLSAEPERSVAVRFRAGPRERDGVIVGTRHGAVLRRSLDMWGGVIDPAPGTFVLSAELARRLAVRPGDAVEVELREGDHRARRLVVAATVDDAVGLSGYLTADDVAAFLREPRTATTAVLRVDPSQRAALMRAIVAIPRVAGVGDRRQTIRRFREQMGTSMKVMTLILTIFASVITIGVVYNNARVALSSRARELASLRVLGFTRREISTILLGELSAQLLLGLPVGLLAGRWLAWLIMGTIDPEQFRFPLTVMPTTYAFASATTLAAGVVSALIVRRKLDRLNLVAVLKERD